MVIKKNEKSKLTPGARFAFAATTTTLTICSTSAREEGGRRIFSEGGAEVAVMELVGERLIVDFLPPADTSAFAKVLRHYGKAPGRPGWLRFERPATRDPGPGLEADFGSLLGAAASQRRNAVAARPSRPTAAARPPVSAPRKRPRAKRHTILSAGGAYLGVAKSKVDFWPGADDTEAYSALAHGGDGASLTTFGKKVPTLVLGTPDRLAWVPNAEGGVLVSVVSFDADDDGVLDGHLGAIPSDGWVAVKGTLPVDGPIWVFDAAIPGGALARSDTLELELEKGRLKIEERTWHPDEGTELFLVRLSR